MSGRSRSALLLAIVLAVATALTGCVAPATPAPSPTAEAVAPEEKPAEGTPYKVGFLAAITGGAAFLGEPERNAAVMIQKQLDAQGGIVGPDGVRHRVQLLIHDTEGKGDVAIPVAKKIISDDGVVASVAGTTSGVSMALVPVFQEAEVVMVSMASSSAIVEPVSERKWIFKTAQSNKHTAPWQVRYAKAKGYTKVANFYVHDAYGEDGASAIREAAKAEGIEIVLEETFNAGDADMTAQLTKLKASDAQALLVTAITPAAPVLTKQFREMGLEIPLIHNHGIGMKPFITLAGVENAEGVVFPMGKLVAADQLPDGDPQKQVLQQFIRDYEASAGGPASTFAGHGWDAVMLILKGLEKLPDGLSLEEQRTRLRDEIENLKGFAGTGGVFNLSPEDHVGLSPDDVVMVRITNGEWEYFPPEKW
ncbi:MAG: ABC transporter substrate-binding protein [Chloroflexi bacterium]|nr:ABC transporter substrate-binding protein [Chloroflexota bacterium]